MSKAACKDCSYYKMVSDPNSKQISKVCFANPPVVSAVMTPRGLAVMTNRPPVQDDDFCHLFLGNGPLN